jgi:hypothetical protein
MENCQEIYCIPGKLKMHWNDEVKAIIDTWTSYQVTLDEFAFAILEKGLIHAKENDAVAWIVDSNKAVGTFTRECQRFIATDIFPSFAKNGIKYFITINSKNTMTNFTVKEYQAKAQPNGLLLVEVLNVYEAVEWLHENIKS